MTVSSGHVVRGADVLTLRGTPLSKRERRRLRRAAQSWAQGRSFVDRAVTLDREPQRWLPLETPPAPGPLNVGDRVWVTDPDGHQPPVGGIILLVHPDGQNVWDETLLSIRLDTGEETEALPGDVTLQTKGSAYD